MSKTRTTTPEVPSELFQRLQMCQTNGLIYAVTADEEEELRTFQEYLKTKRAARQFDRDALHELTAITDYALKSMGKNPADLIPVVVIKLEEFLSKERFMGDYLFAYEMPSGKILSSGSSIDEAKNMALIYDVVKTCAERYDMTPGEFIFKMMRKYDEESKSAKNNP